MTTADVHGASISSAVPRQVSQWPVQARLLDEDGQLLGEVELVSPAGTGGLLLGEVAAPAILLGYYFGKAGRRLMLDLGDRVIDGWLETRWQDGKRTWWVEVGEEPTS